METLRGRARPAAGRQLGAEHARPLRARACSAPTSPRNQPPPNRSHPATYGSCWGNRSPPLVVGSRHSAAYHQRVSETPDRLRELPSVDRVLADPRIEALAESHGREPVVDAVRRALALTRQDLQAGITSGDVVARAEAELAATLATRLRRVINATGIVLHTNLGRAPAVGRR